MSICASNCALESVDLTGCTGVETLNLRFNRLCALDITDCTELDGINDTYLDGQFSGCSLTAWQYPVYGNNGIYVDFAANGLGNPSAEDMLIYTGCGTATIAAYNGKGAILLEPEESTFEQFNDGSFSFGIKCKGQDGIYLMGETSCVLKTGSPFTFPESIVLSADDTAGAQFNIYNSDGSVLDLDSAGYALKMRVESGEGVTADATGLIKPVTPACPGRNDICFTLYMPGYEDISVMCDFVSVDVVSGNISDPVSGVEGISLKESSVNVEIYKTDYTVLNLVLEMEQNEVYASNALKDEEDIEKPADSGYAVESAEFEGDAAEWFELVPTGDNKLNIVPRYDKLQYAYGGGKVPGSFTTRVKVQISGGGEPFTTGSLKISLKKTLPKVTAKPITLNTWGGVDWEYMPVYPDVTVKPYAEVKGVKILDNSLPDWVTLSQSDWSLIYTGQEYATQSATVKLALKLEGYAIEPEVSIKLTAKPSRPSFKASASSVKLLSDSGDCAVVTMSVNLGKAYGDNVDGVSLFPSYVTETVSGLTYDVTYTQSEDYVSTEDKLLITTGYEPFALNIKVVNPDNQKHTYKVYYYIVGQIKCVTVNVLPASSAKAGLTVKALKNSGNIDLVCESTYTGFTVTGKNCGMNTRALYYLFNEDLEHQDEDGYQSKIEVREYYGTKLDENFNVSGHFSYSMGEDALFLELNDASGLRPGKYTLVITANMDGTYVSGTCSFTVKQSKEITVKLAVKGKLEAYAESSAIVTITSANYPYAGDFPEACLHFYADKDCIRSADAYFNVKSEWNYNLRKYETVIEPYACIEPGTYYLRYESDSDTDGTADVFSKPVKLTVKGTLPKINLSVKEVTLSSKDCYSTGTVAITGNSNRLIDHVEVADKKLISTFTVVGLTNFVGRAAGSVIAVKWPSDKITLKSGTTKTVKLNVWYEGLSKPVTVSVKVKVK